MKSAVQRLDEVLLFLAFLIVEYLPRRIMNLIPFVVFGAGLISWGVAFCDLSLNGNIRGFSAIAGGLMMVIGAVAYTPES